MAELFQRELLVLGEIQLFQFGGGTEIVDGIGGERIKAFQIQGF